MAAEAEEALLALMISLYFVRELAHAVPEATLTLVAMDIAIHMDALLEVRQRKSAS